MRVDKKITVLVPTSPIPSHPAPTIIRETLESIRFHLPGSEIVIMADGLRAEQEKEYRDRYRRFYGELAAMATFDLDGISLLPHSEHLHQVGMLRRAMTHFVNTPLVLFCEHDTPLTELPIDWGLLAGAIEQDYVDSVRFLPEPDIHPEHQHLMCGPVPGITDVLDRPVLTKTIQFSARPHLASAIFYNKMLLRFSPQARTFTEDLMHSICQARGCDGWADWKMAVYTPEGNKQRSRHLCGRGDDPKFDDQLVF